MSSLLPFVWHIRVAIVSWTECRPSATSSRLPIHGAGVSLWNDSPTTRHAEEPTFSLQTLSHSGCISLQVLRQPFWELLESEYPLSFLRAGKILYELNLEPVSIDLFLVFKDLGSLVGHKQNMYHLSSYVVEQVNIINSRATTDQQQQISCIFHSLSNPLVVAAWIIVPKRILKSHVTSARNNQNWLTMSAMDWGWVGSMADDHSIPTLDPG